MQHYNVVKLITVDNYVHEIWVSSKIKNSECLSSLLRIFSTQIIQLKNGKNYIKNIRTASRFYESAKESL